MSIMRGFFTKAKSEAIEVARKLRFLGVPEEKRIQILSNFSVYVEENKDWTINFNSNIILTLF